MYNSLIQIYLCSIRCNARAFIASSSENTEIQCKASRYHYWNGSMLCHLNFIISRIGLIMFEKLQIYRSFDINSLSKTMSLNYFWPPILFYKQKIKIFHWTNYSALKIAEHRHYFPYVHTNASTVNTFKISIYIYKMEKVEQFWSRCEIFLNTLNLFNS